MTNPRDFAFVYEGVLEIQPGLTKREYFAAKAMEGFMTNPNTNFNEAVNAQYAVAAADALIAELNKSQEAKP